MTERYDSKADTEKHIGRVQELLDRVTGEIERRAEQHDASKLADPEKALFDEYTPKLRELEYGSQEYKDCLAGLGPALQHHYANNSHHPEHYADGVAGMSLLDLIEMLADWKAAGERHATGSMAASLRINRDRFGLSEQLARVLENTARELGWL